MITIVGNNVIYYSDISIDRIPIERYINIYIYIYTYIYIYIYI